MSSWRVRFPSIKHSGSISRGPWRGSRTTSSWGQGRLLPSMNGWLLEKLPLLLMSWLKGSCPLDKMESKFLRHKSSMSTLSRSGDSLEYSPRTGQSMLSSKSHASATLLPWYLSQWGQQKKLAFLSSQFKQSCRQFVYLRIRSHWY